MTDLPRVSVILCSLNGEERIGAAIASVLEQTYRDLELIVVDDGSTDATASVVTQTDDPRLRLLRFPENRGVYAARIAAIADARGELLAFIDDDDVWLPHKLQRQLDLLAARPAASLVHGCCEDVTPDGRVLRRPYRNDWSSYESLLTHDSVCTSTVLLRRSAYDAVGGFDTSFRAFGDWDLWTRVARDHEVAYLPEVVARIHLRQGSIQRGAIDNFVRYRAQALDKRRPELVRLGLERKAMSLHHYAIAAKLNAQGRREEARREALKSLRLRPDSQALALLGLTLLAPERAQRVRRQLRTLRNLVGQ